MRYLGLDVGELDLLKYDREQPRVPAGNGRESGRWTSGGEGSDVAPDLAPGIRGHVDLITESKPARLLPRRRYAQTVVPDIPDGTPVEPYGELNTSLSNLPSGSKQVLQWRFFVQDDKTKQWHIGMSVPASTESGAAMKRRGKGAGIEESGVVLSPPLPEQGSGKNPRSGIRIGLENKVTGQPYFRVYNDQGEAISPVTGGVVLDQSPLAHYPFDPFHSPGPR